MASIESRSNNASPSARPALEEVVVGEPERAGQERTLAARQTVDLAEAVARVPQDEAVGAQVAFDRGNRAHDTRVGRGEEADEGDHQQAGVELGAAERLGEGLAVGVVAVVADLGVDVGSQSAATARAAPAARTARRP